MKKYTFKEFIFVNLSNLVGLLSKDKYSLRSKKVKMKYDNYIEEIDYIIDIGVAYWTDLIEEKARDKEITYILKQILFSTN